MYVFQLGVATLGSGRLHPQPVVVPVICGDVDLNGYDTALSQWPTFKLFRITLQETNISPKNGILKMIFLFPRWDMLIPWRVYI